MPNYVGITRRPTFDLLFGSFGQIEHELMESRTALAQTAAQYRELTANINQGFWLYDPTLKKVTYVSPAYEEIWGLSFEIAHQNPTNFLKMIHSDDRQHIQALLPTQLNGNYDEVFRVVHDDGTMRWVRDRAFVIYDEGGAVYRLAGISEDITERKRAEAHLRYVSDFRELIATLAIDFITIRSEEIDSRIAEVMRLIGEFVDADRVFLGPFLDNQEALRGVYEWCAAGIEPLISTIQHVPTLDFPPALERLRNLETLFVPKVVDWPDSTPMKEELIRSGVQSAIVVPLVSGGGLIGLLGLHKITGVKDWTEDTATLLKIVGQIYVNAIERQQAEQTLLDNQKLQLELEKEKELSDFRVQFISMVSHEFRTPLSVIHTASSILEYHTEQLKPEQRKGHFVRIASQVEHLSGMLDDVLFMMRAEAGHLKYTPEPLDYDDFCEEIIERLRLTASENHQLIFECEGELKDLAGDTTLLGHVVTNLLGNAIKYSPNGGQIKVGLRRQGDQVLLTVSDEGIGMSAEDQAQLFEPYFRAKNVGKIRGTGLGLKITADCVALHGGTIAVESALGVGTTFRVVIPIEG
jgi:PAS domain S-box-containing protein